MQNNLRFTISVQVTIITNIVVMLGGIVVSSVVAVLRVGRASFLIVAGGVAAAVSALVARAELHWVPRVCSAEHAALAVLFGMVGG